eukprot:COSAG03_NODE_2450_length_2748_cov_4.417516_1_plen_137_part_00
MRTRGVVLSSLEEARAHLLCSPCMPRTLATSPRCQLGALCAAIPSVPSLSPAAYELRETIPAPEVDSGDGRLVRRTDGSALVDVLTYSLHALPKCNCVARRLRPRTTRGPVAAARAGLPQRGTGTQLASGAGTERV